MNPFGRMDGGPTADKAPVGILNIETPAAPVIQEDPSIVDQGIGMAKDKALDVAMNKGTEMATSAATKAAAGKGGAAAGGVYFSRRFRGRRVLLSIQRDRSRRKGRPPRSSSA